MDGFTIGQNALQNVLMVGKILIVMLLLYIYILGLHGRYSKHSRGIQVNRTPLFRLLGWCGISVLVGFWIMEMTSFIHYALVASVFFEDKQALATILGNVAKPVIMTSYLIIGATIINLIFNVCIERGGVKGRTGIMLFP